MFAVCRIIDPSLLLFYFFHRRETTPVVLSGSAWWLLSAETLIRLPWDNWDSYEVGLLEHPIVTKTAINVGIYLLGDWLSQVCNGREVVSAWPGPRPRTGSFW